ncbi:MAG: hypothetical protein CMH54_05165 [Myxococcales bacterium]|nr:hypothetical protein [Myxococcales bacterium]|tara:strand:+ start:454 stop:909 length:456 start_codon:yes stop_codon:yes gene_type:complete
MKTHYEVLGVPKDASPEEIARAYKKLVAQYHPDRHQGHDLEDLAKDKLVELNEAYEVLSDPNKRRIYDQQIVTGRGVGRAPGTRQPPGGPGGKFSAPSFLRPIFGLLALAGFGLALRFLRNPRVFVVAIIVVAIIWLSAVLLRGKDKNPRE